LLVNDVLHLVEDLPSPLWMLTRDFLGLVDQISQAFTDAHHSSSVDIDHHINNWPPVRMAALFGSLRDLNPARKKESSLTAGGLKVSQAGCWYT
jgi:hypothetical protein